jgi:predicted alpha/beta superfamily hydrolase/ketosteroid isomerase-like protein
VSSLALVACGKEAPRAPSAASNVAVLEHEFTIPDLNRPRLVRMYLPPDYETSERHYPVLYMHDGQNLFDDSTSYAGEWGVDETLNELFDERAFGLIVVGIDNGGDKRMSELSPWPNEEFGAAEGRQYMDFLVNEVKAFVDQNYRTLPDQENTAIMGSSMGGLISHYAIFEYPHVFSKAGIFSPSYWFSDEVYATSQPGKLADNARLYILMGGSEGRKGISDMERMATQLLNDGMPENRLESRVVPDGEHNESFWRTHFPAAVTWLFEDAHAESMAPLPSLVAADPAAEVRCRETGFSQAAEEQDLDAFRSFIDADARFVSNNVLRGVDAIAETWAVFFADDGPRIKWRPQIVEVLEDGRLALSRGPYRITARDEDGDAIERWGTFNSVWRPGADGEWRVVFDAGSPAAAPPDQATRDWLDAADDCR